MDAMRSRVAFSFAIATVARNTRSTATHVCLPKEGSMLLYKVNKEHADDRA
jgi:hypothetical protein